ncbi:hypothetical protein [Micromonospora sp. DT233]|uniref:hypothetical protein n=1 Tax=Micromonospora sp. DT233 TaxID=3393432 RepID=UPI003CF158C5
MSRPRAATEATVGLPEFVHRVIRQLRRRGLPLGVDDCDALRRALAAGFGWSSDQAFEELCVMLWARSTAEAAVVRATLARAELPAWNALRLRRIRADDTEDWEHQEAPTPEVEPTPEYEEWYPPITHPVQGLAMVPPSSGVTDPTLVLVPQYPVTGREIAQIWRTLRRPVRQGPPAELDVAATVAERARTGVATPPVLVPYRRNAARVCMLIDRQGSMTPFHGYVDHLWDTVRRSGRLSALTVGYFHDVPGYSLDRGVLATLADPFRPDLDPVLSQIRPLTEGWLYTDPELTDGRAVDAALAELTPAVGVAVISDAGAARGRLDTVRLLDTIALLKALYRHAGAVVWLNPAPPARWPRSTAAQIARHVPMLPLTRSGLYQAVGVLRGHPVPTERPL